MRSSAAPDDRAATFAARIGQVRSVCDRMGFAGALLSARRNVAWLTAGADAHVVRASDEAAAAVRVTADRVTIVTTVIESRRLVDEELVGLDVELIALPWAEPLSGSLSELGGRFAVDADLEPELRRLRARLLSFETDLVEPGMAFAWNPSLTGVKVEDTLLLNADGTRELVTRTGAWPLDEDRRPIAWGGTR